MLLPSSCIMIVPACMPILSFSWPSRSLPSFIEFYSVLAKSQPRASSLHASRVSVRIPKTTRFKLVEKTNRTVVDHGPQMAVLQMMKQIWIPKQTVVSVKVITRWRASGTVITMARALCFSPRTPVRSEYVYHTLCGSDLSTSPFSALVSRHSIYDLLHDYSTLSVL